MSLRSFFNEDKIEVGVDEVGRGCLAGPVVAAAVIWPRDYQIPQLNDSKQLSSKSRKLLIPRIEENSIDFAIGWASPKEIDEINILKASFLAMHRALGKLTVPFDHILVDGNRFNPFESYQHTCIVKGDGKFLSIAAASIIAKEYRDNLMEGLGEEYPYYDWASNKGYPTAKHRKGIKDFGITSHHRKSFNLQPNQIPIFKE